jgi:hypothetical protein
MAGPSITGSTTLNTTKKQKQKTSAPVCSSKRYQITDDQALDLTSKLADKVAPGMGLFTKYSMKAVKWTAEKQRKLGVAPVTTSATTKDIKKKKK